MRGRPVVVKVGGSLFDLPDLRDRLGHWLDSVKSDRVVLVPGGGRGADVIRSLDAVHMLGEEASHWLALRVLSINAHFLARLLDVPVVSDIEPHGPKIAALDTFEFCRDDDRRSGSLKHCWQVTSDSIAARVAQVLQADLCLLKSTDILPGIPWEKAAATGLVDEAFASIVAQANLHVAWINLRAT